MAFDDLKKLTTGFIKGWKKGKLKETLQETAQIAMEEKIKNAELEDKVGQLEDEIRRLKGEKPRPKIKPKSTKDLNPPAKKPRGKKSKKKDLEIDEEVECDVDKSELPIDAKFVGCRDVVIQEMIIQRRNIRFKIRRYYSQELGKVFEGNIPDEYKDNEFGPQLRSFILYQYYKCRTPHDKIRQLLFDWGIDISSGTICSIINNLKSDFFEDLKSARDAGLTKSSQVHIDETGAKCNGDSLYTFGVSNRFFTQYTTSFEKNRWAAVGALLGGEEKFVISDEAVSFVAKKLKRPHITVHLTTLKSDKTYTRQEFEQLFSDDIFNDVTKKQRDIIRTAASLSSLRTKTVGPPIKFLISDDAPNFNDLVKNHQLCWVHEIRRYKLADIYKDSQVMIVDDLVNRWRALYHLMKEFINSQSTELRKRIREEFNKITGEKTGIRLIDEMLLKTKKREHKLLLFLKYPQLPLHNNLSENDLRERVIKRKISLQNRSKQGSKAWDVMLSLASTCRKNDLSFWRYLEDRISCREAIPPLGKYIASHS